MIWIFWGLLFAAALVSIYKMGEMMLRAHFESCGEDWCPSCYRIKKKWS